MFIGGHFSLTSLAGLVIEKKALYASTETKNVLVGCHRATCPAEGVEGLMIDLAPFASPSQTGAALLRGAGAGTLRVGGDK